MATFTVFGGPADGLVLHARQFRQVADPLTIRGRTFWLIPGGDRVRAILAGEIGRDDWKEPRRSADQLQEVLDGEPHDAAGEIPAAYTLHRSAANRFEMRLAEAECDQMMDQHVEDELKECRRRLEDLIAERELLRQELEDLRAADWWKRGEPPPGSEDDDADQA